MISHAARLYFWFPLRLRMAEEMLVAHGFEASELTCLLWYSSEPSPIEHAWSRIRAQP